ncbi:MAG: hypothetical protein Q7V57_16410 [Actinomycetota bacterium]|nr:hypothetical protein [Actinomycetota bacterium]
MNTSGSPLPPPIGQVPAPPAPSKLPRGRMQPGAQWLLGAVAALAVVGVGVGVFAAGNDSGSTATVPTHDNTVVVTSPDSTLGTVDAPTTAVVTAPLVTTAATTPATQPPPSLAGIWRGSATDILGNPATVETVLQPGGGFTQTFYSSGPQIYIAGTWYVVQPGEIRFNITDHTDEWCGPLGCTQIQLQSGETTYYTFRDANTLETWGWQNTTHVIHTRIG